MTTLADIEIKKFCCCQTVSRVAANSQLGKHLLALPSISNSPYQPSPHRTLRHSTRSFETMSLRSPGRRSSAIL